jgi:hypothetical protein
MWTDVIGLHHYPYCRRDLEAKHRLYTTCSSLSGGCSVDTPDHL